MKRISAICVFVLSATLLLFATTSDGPNSPGAGGNGGSGTAWADTGNITASDDSRATATLIADALSQDLQATQFGFDLPAGTVDGVTASIEREEVSGTGVCEDGNVRLLIGGTASGDDKATAGAWPLTEASQAYGGTADLWGLTPTVAQVNATDFGFHVKVGETSTNAVVCGVDHMTLTVTHSAEVGGQRRIITRNAGKITIFGEESKHDSHSLR